MAELIPIRGGKPPPSAPFFSSGELRQLISFYSSRVISGEWRDYAIDRSDDMAVFSIFRKTEEQPALAIAKQCRANQSAPSFALFVGCRKMGSAARLPDILDRLERLPRLVKS